MQLSRPVHILKRMAKAMAREKNIPLHRALDHVARQEGFKTWSLLSAQRISAGLPCDIYDQLENGELVLAGARPGQGKTLFCIKLAIEAMNAGHKAYFFSLEDTRHDLEGRFEAVGAPLSHFSSRFVFDGSDEISAGYIIDRISKAAPGTFVVVDYLQLLDQKRERPDLAAQVSALKNFALERRVTIVFISQIDRSFALSSKSLPDLSDVRLPNPLDLGLFDKACFLHKGKTQLLSAA